MSTPKLVGMVLTVGPVASMLSAEFAIGINAETYEELHMLPPGAIAVPLQNLVHVDDHERHSRLASLVFSDKKNQEEFGSPQTFGDGDSQQQAQFDYYYRHQLKKMKTAWEDVHKHFHLRSPCISYAIALLPNMLMCCRLYAGISWHCPSA